MISVFSTTLQDEELTEGVTYLQTKETGLQHDIIVDCGKTYEYYKHPLCLYIVNGNNVIPALVTKDNSLQTSDHLDVFIEEGSHLVKDPFLVDMVELSLDAESILNPFVDVLGLFSSYDTSLKDFAIRNQVGPASCAGDIYSKFTKEGHHHVIMRFVGTKVIIEQISTIPKIKNAYFEVDARNIMNKYGVSTPEEIYPYLKEHFNRKNCYKVLRKDLFGL